jgi:hypothetical protein
MATYSYSELFEFLKQQVGKDFAFAYDGSSVWIGGSLMRIKTHKKNEFDLCFAYYKLHTGYCEKDWGMATIQKYEGSEPISNFPFRLMTTDEKDELTRKNTPLYQSYLGRFPSRFRIGKSVNFFADSKHTISGGKFMIDKSCNDKLPLVSNYYSPNVELNESDIHLIFPFLWGFYDGYHQFVWFMFSDTEEIIPKILPPPNVENMLNAIDKLSTNEKGINILIQGPSCSGKTKFLRDLTEQKRCFDFQIPKLSLFEGDGLSAYLKLVNTQNLIISVRLSSDIPIGRSFLNFLDQHQSIVFILTTDTHLLSDENLCNRVHLFVNMESPKSKTKLNSAQKRLFSELSDSDLENIINRYSQTQTTALYS